MFSVRNRLSLMMFLEIFIWGAWLPLIFSYLAGLNFNAWQQGLILNAFAICSISTLVFSANLADRYFAAEKFLAFSHFVGGLAMLGLFFVKDFYSILILMFVHSFFYVPTMSVANSISFANIKNSKDFGLVRLWGTIGWIAASWPFIFILVDYTHVPEMSKVGFVTWLGEVFKNGLQGQALIEGTRYAFIVSGVAALLCSAVSLTLPHTPPKKVAEGANAPWLESLKLLKYPFILVLFICTMIDATVHQCFFLWTGTFLKQDVGIPGNWVNSVMSIGQVAEILTMIFLGTVLKNFGWKFTMIIGILGHTVRFAVFAMHPSTAGALTVMLLHGICYAFFFATVYIFVDDVFPKNMRTTAQGLFNLVILGAGPFVGNFLWPYISAKFTTGVGDAAVTDFGIIFWVPSILAAVAALLILVAFHPPKSANEDEAVAEHPPEEEPVPNV